MRALAVALTRVRCSAACAQALAALAVVLDLLDEGLLRCSARLWRIRMDERTVIL